MRSKYRLRSYILIITIFLISFFQSFNYIALNDQIKTDHNPFSSLTPGLEWLVQWDNGDGDKSYDLVIDSNDNVIMVGDTDIGGNYNVLILKYDKLGNQIWNKSWDNENYERAFGVTLDEFDNIYITGRTGVSVSDYDIFLIKLNKSGNIQWNSTWGDLYNDYGHKVALDSAGKIYVTGLITTYYSADICLVKFDNDGNYLLNRTFGHKDQFDAGYGISINKSTDEIFVTGQTALFDGDGDVCLIKYSNLVVEEWNETWGDVNKESGSDIVLYSNKIYIVGELHGDSLLMEYNSTGGLEWYSTWGDVHTQCGRAMIIDNRGDIYITGYSGISGNNNIFLLKYNNTGTNIWEKIWSYSNRAEGEGIALDSSKDIYITGWITSPWDLVLLKYNQYAPSSFELSTDANDPDFDGKFDLFWNESLRSNRYSVYSHDSYITKINGSITLLNDSITNLQFSVSNLSHDLIYYKIVAHNAVGNVSSNCIYINMVLSPKIIIESPILDQFFGHQAPMFNLTIKGRYLSKTWYTIDRGVNNYTFYGNSGTINQIAWESQNTTEISIAFYINNSFNNKSFSEIKVKKDIIKPLIIINSPNENQKFTIDAPLYSISVVEPNLESILYTIDNGIINITITQLIANISQDAWVSAPNGDITINFYARDKAGNVGSNSVIVKKASSISIIIPVSSITVMAFIGVVILFIIIFVRKNTIIRFYQ